VDPGKLGAEQSEAKAIARFFGGKDVHEKDVREDERQGDGVDVTAGGKPAIDAPGPPILNEPTNDLG
jgi:hypothetical protein